MNKLILATKNPGKLSELKQMLAGVNLQIISLQDINAADVVEDGASFLENARKKALAAASSDRWVLADDSGLCVDALNGAPGIYSARYAGRQGDDAANNAKLLANLAGKSLKERAAAFVCAMVLIAPDGQEWSFEGHLEGVIGFEERGCGGFGYDPLFILPDLGKTSAELSATEKNSLSHRGQALCQAVEVLVAKLAKDG